MATFGVAELGAPASPDIVYLAEQDFRQQTATMVLKSGLIVSGSVVDEQGKPIARAKVIEKRDWRDSWAAQLTGADGRFRLANTSPGELVVTVEADGYVASDRTIHPEAPGDELQFVLAPAALLRGRVVDETGAPVEATVSARGGDFENGRFDWSATTDAEGRFEWHSAPPAQRLYYVQAPGYEPLKQVELVADGTEELVTLHQSNQPPPARISGTVTDGETGQPIDDFQVWMGMKLAEQGPGGTTMFAEAMATLQTTGKEGKFAFPCLVSAASYTLQIKTEGYVMTQVNIPGPLTNNCRFDLKLKRDELVAGTVLTPDGKPVAGAVVMACSERARAYMNLPGQFNLTTSRAAHTTTDEDGCFSLPDAAGAKRIIVAQTAGYAELAREQFSGSRIITLQPWGRIEGTLKIGNRPGGGETILVYDRPQLPEAPGLGLHLMVITDSAGGFVIENVPPGEWQIAHVLQASGALTQCAPVHVQAGQTTRVRLGGTGWRVVGRIRSGDATEPINWQRDLQTLNLKSPDAPPASRQYALVFGTNGAFTIDDVPPGTYELNVVVTAPGSSGSRFDGKFLGTLH
jgi:Carboxypeptidase regulatory-like domain